MITTTQNKQIKQIIKLKKSARERRKQELFLVEGIRMFTEIPEEYLYKVYASEDFYNEHRVIFEHMDVELVSPQVMKEISDTMTPQGVLALVKMMKYSLEDLLEQEKPLFLVLENLQDPGNLGTILRTGEGAGITHVLYRNDLRYHCWCKQTACNVQRSPLPACNRFPLFLPIAYGDDYRYTAIPCRILGRTDFT